MSRIAIVPVGQAFDFLSDAIDTELRTRGIIVYPSAIWSINEPYYADLVDAILTRANAAGRSQGIMYTFEEAYRALEERGYVSYGEPAPYIPGTVTVTPYPGQVKIERPALPASPEAVTITPVPGQAKIERPALPASPETVSVTPAPGQVKLTRPGETSDAAKWMLIALGVLLLVK
jgi:hypothetical protein